MKNLFFKTLIIFLFCSFSLNLSSQTEVINMSNNTKSAILQSSDEPLFSQPISTLQQSGSNFNFDRLFLGGSLGGHISNNSYYFNISPQIGYYILKYPRFKLLQGASFMFQYYQTTTAIFQARNTYSPQIIYGPGLFTRCYYKDFFTHAEFQHLWNQYDNKKIDDNYFLIGVGASFTGSGRFGLSLSILFDVLSHQKEEYEKIYDNPIISIGVTF